MSNTRRLRGRDWAPLSRDLQRTLDAVPPGRIRADIDRAAPGFMDQADAAAAETGREHARFRARMKAEPGGAEADPGRVPADILHQVRGLFLRVVTEMCSGQRRHCPHLTPPGSVAAAVAPVYDDWIACLRCLPRYQREPRLSGREEYTCDLCGRYRHEQTISHLFPAIGFVTLIIGICPRCTAQVKDAEL